MARVEAQREPTHQLVGPLAPEDGLQVAAVVPLRRTDALQKLARIGVRGEPPAHVLDHVDLFLVRESHFFSSCRVRRVGVGAGGRGARGHRAGYSARTGTRIRALVRGERGWWWEGDGQQAAWGRTWRHFGAREVHAEVPIGRRGGAGEEGDEIDAAVSVRVLGGRTDGARHCGGVLRQSRRCAEVKGGRRRGKARCQTREGAGVERRDGGTGGVERTNVGVRAWHARIRDIHVAGEGRIGSACWGHQDCGRRIGGCVVAVRCFCYRR